MYENLRDFVDALSRAGELKRISAPVSPVLEVAEITDRVSKSAAPNAPSPSARRNDPRHSHLGGHALLFDNVEGSDIPVLINAYGSYRRTEMALGCDDHGHTPGGFDALADKVAKLVKPEPPPTLDFSGLSEIHVDPTSGENDAETDYSGTMPARLAAGAAAFVGDGGLAVTDEADPRLRPIDPELLKNVSRNAPCPCGSGRKFKHCHGSF